MRRLTEAVVYMHDNGEQVHVCVSEGGWVGGWVDVRVNVCTQSVYVCAHACMCILMS